MERNWETRGEVPLILFAITDEKEERNKFAISIPYVTSVILAHSISGVVKGLKEWEKSERPTVKIVFYSFRVMVGLGMIYLLIAVLSLYLRYKKTLYSNTLFLKFVRIFGFTGSIAVIAGWFVTEVGRQTWVVWGMMRIKDASTPRLTVNEVTFSLASIVILYILILIPLFIYLKRLFKCINYNSFFFAYLWNCDVRNSRWFRFRNCQHLSIF
jgi:cytochrome bd ubiquinol oxidase subunit I